MKWMGVNNWSGRDKKGKLLYVWPYTNRCPDCDEEAMDGYICTSCKKDNHQEKCAVCGTWQNNRYFTEWGGCVKCTGKG